MSLLANSVLKSVRTFNLSVVVLVRFVGGCCPCVGGGWCVCVVGLVVVGFLFVGRRGPCVWVGFVFFPPLLSSFWVFWFGLNVDFFVEPLIFNFSFPLLSSCRSYLRSDGVTIAR